MIRDDAEESRLARMIRIPLEFARGHHQPSLAAGHELPVVRLLANISLRADTGWTPARKAVVDTGATVSLIPKDVWREATFQTIVRVRAAGVVNRSECTIPATLATVTCLLLHGTSHIGPLAIHAILADSDRVPLLLGMSGILDRLRVMIDLPRELAFIEGD